MEERLPELLALAIVAMVAVIMGLLFVRLKQPPIVGYILAGVVLGPAGIGLVPNTEQIPLLAELGVLMLLFVIGMEISVVAFMRDLRPAVITVAGQIFVALAAMAAFGAWLGWKVEQVLLLGFIMTMSSTAVALKMLEDIDELRSNIGRITVAVLIAQDIAVVPILILARSFGGGAGLDATVAATILLAVGGLVLFIRYLGRRGKVGFPGAETVTGRVDLVTMSCLAICFVAATISGFLGLSAAYGAFLAGLYVGRTKLRSEAIQALEPIQSVLMVVFFLSIGLLLDVAFILANWQLVTLFVCGVLCLKTLSNILILRLAGLSGMDAFTAGLTMGQIGEFSFVIAATGASTGLLFGASFKLAITVIALSLLVSPLWMSALRRVHAAAELGIANLRKAFAVAYSREIDEIEDAQAWLVRVLGRLPGVRRRQEAASLALVHKEAGGEAVGSEQPAAPVAISGRSGKDQA
ncbi:MAG: cation:proton antiporter [Hyphomicrobiaceae bacterium]|nr:cation:proton antiporter [Hyphomicrobiaceae bacterium]